ncbi:MAG: PAS domain S-box protein [Actinomycetota bacterium]|nr:PAS domain S-box protein [Actinomycetota bacterium]
MRTPSLTIRVTVATLVLLALVLGGLNLFLYVTLREKLLRNLDEVLATRANLVRAEAAARGPEELAGRLTQLGIRAKITTAHGGTFEARPPSPAHGQNLPPGTADLGKNPASRVVSLPGGAKAEVFARRTGVEEALSNLLLFEVLGMAAALLVATLLLRRISRATLRPVDEIAAASRRVAAGERGARLRPDRPKTPLGELATAYDAMLDELEAALLASREAEARSERLYHHARMIIETARKPYVAMDTSGRIVDWNTRAEEVFGWRREEVAGRTVEETLVPPEFRRHHAEGLARFLATGEERLIGRQEELEALRSNGSIIPVELMVWITENETTTFNAFVEDISERRRGDEAVAQLAAIVDSARDAVVSQDLEGNIVSWNRGAEVIYGWRAEEVVGRPISIIIPPEEAAPRATMVEQVRTGRAVHTLETVRRCKNGTLIDVSVTLSPVLDRSGAVVGVSTIARDITEQRWMARTLDETLKALESALDQARLSEAYSRRFLADAAHQLRSPITGIRACTETLLRGVPEPERDRLMIHLVREASRASRLLGGLLRLARLDQGQELVSEQTDLVALCEGEAERARALAPHLEIVVDAERAPDALADLDPGAIQEVLSNLLDNARRHAAGRIELAVCRGDNTVEVRVGDDGPGMTAEEAERAFERFVSLDGKGGSGLGLAIAQALARAHGGDLTYKAGDAGKAFVLRLPLNWGPGAESVATGGSGEPLISGR